MTFTRHGTVTLYVAFFACGIGCALPGALLPALLTQWHLSDAQGGLLAFIIWAGTASGALLVRGPLQRVVSAGCGLTALGSAGIALLSTPWVSPAFLLYGLGLGIAMTSISLIRQQTTPERRRGTELVRLNLMWAAGAVLAPSLAVHALHISRANTLLAVFALAFLLLAGCSMLWVSDRVRLQHGGGLSLASWLALRQVPLRLVLLTVLATGIEAGSNTWLATYAQRTQHTLAITVAAPTCLWVGLLSSRVLGSSVRVALAMQQRTAVLTGLVMVSACTVAAQPGPVVLLAAAYLLGFGLGPLYPILLARVLRYRETGTIFFLAGVCSATLPWLAGVASSGFHSLRAGIAVIAAAAVVFALLSLADAGTREGSFVG